MSNAKSKIKSRITAIILKPVKTEKSLALADRYREVVVEVDKRATKSEVSQEFEDLFGVKVDGVRTYITPKGKKRAIVRISKESNFDDLVSKLKMI